MYGIRVASLCFVGALVLAPLPARAQGPSNNLNALNARVTALEAAVAALQGANTVLDGRVDKLESGEVTADDRVGTYRVLVFATDLTGNPATVQTETGSATFTLEAGGAASFSGMGQHCRLLQASPWFVECDDPEGGSGTGTWFVDSEGSLRLLDSGGRDLIGDENFIGAGGRVIIAGGTLDATEIPNRTPEVYSNIMIAIRLPNP